MFSTCTPHDAVTRHGGMSSMGLGERVAGDNKRGCGGIHIHRDFSRAALVFLKGNGLLIVVARAAVALVRIDRR